jgi:hypothetical protein
MAQQPAQDERVAMSKPRNRRINGRACRATQPGWSIVRPWAQCGSQTSMLGITRIESQGTREPGWIERGCRRKDVPSTPPEEVLGRPCAPDGSSALAPEGAAGNVCHHAVSSLFWARRGRGVVRKRSSRVSCPVSFFLFRNPDTAGRRAHDVRVLEISAPPASIPERAPRAPRMQRRCGTSRISSAQTRQSPSRIPPPVVAICPAGRAALFQFK